MDVTANHERQQCAPDAWLRAKLHNYSPQADSDAVSALIRSAGGAVGADQRAPFDNPFSLEDLAALDDETLRLALDGERSSLSSRELAVALTGASASVSRRLTSALSAEARVEVELALPQPALLVEIEEARKRLLDALFWELTYWKTPDLYEALTEGERMHPALFSNLAPLLREKVVLDVGAGSGRATVECLRLGARQIYAVEPSPGLLQLLDRKLGHTPGAHRILPLRGRFEALPLGDDSVDTVISCSAFTARPAQGGELGLAELRRVTRPGGTIVIIWPRPEDYGWLAAHGFHYVVLPMPERMSVRFRSVEVALRVLRRFYPRNQAAMRFLRRSRSAEIPFRLLGNNPPHDFCWRIVEQ